MPVANPISSNKAMKKLLAIAMLAAGFGAAVHGGQAILSGKVFN
jgi:hypothetical protein